MFHAIPTQLADVDQSVDAAQIDKRAKVFHAAHDAFAKLADGELFEQLVAQLLPLALHHGPMTQDQVLPVAVRFGDDARQPLADVFFGVFDAIHR